jgi:RNA polymerase sigma factor (sigma-70 family)
MRDREIVAAIVAGQPAGLAAAYDQYAAALHAYCRSLLAEPADAADAVQDTFIIASAKLDGLRDPDRLRPWLYAVARNECRRRLRARASAAPLDEAGEVTDESADVGVSAERAELRMLVGAALAGLNPGEREIIELNLRHELDGADLADALGVPRNQAHALASRARTQFETSLGALLVARTGREDCPELDAILAGWDGQLTVLLRKRVNRHIERCDICGDRKRRQLSPAMLLSMLPVALLPAGLRQQLFRLVADTHPAAAAYRARVIHRAGPFTSSGFPRPLDPPHTGHGIKGYAIGAAAVIVILAAAGGGVVFAADMVHHHHPPGATQAAGPPSSAPASSVAAVQATISPTPTPTPSAAATTSAPPPVTTLPAAPPPPSPTSKSPKPTPTPTKTVKPGTLSETPPRVPLSQTTSASGQTSWTGTFTLTASGGPVEGCTITVDQADAKYLTVSPASGSLANGQTVTVTVTVPSASLFSTATLTINPGPITVTVYYQPVIGAPQG